MKNTSDDTSAIDQRLHYVASLTGAREKVAVEEPVITQTQPPSLRGPTPRRGRIFLRNGGGRGRFADLTLTAPITRSYLT